MRVKIILATAMLLICNNIYAMQLNGSVAKQEIINKNKVTDKETGVGIGNANITIPANGFATFSDSDGNFKLPQNISAPYVISVEKDGYSPFSLTVHETGAALTIEIQKSSLKKLAIESDTYHLGDGMFSDHSANATQFKLTPSGSTYEKAFKIKRLAPNERAYISIGSVIGIDTLAAKNLGQTDVQYSYSSAPKVYFNSKEISRLHINEDNKKILIPKNLIRQDGQNVIKIIAGVNLFQNEYTDYDDFEFTHLFLEIE